MVTGCGVWVHWPVKGHLGRSPTVCLYQHSVMGMRKLIRGMDTYTCGSSWLCKHRKNSCEISVRCPGGKECSNIRRMCGLLWQWRANYCAVLKVGRTWLPRSSEDWAASFLTSTFPKSLSLAFGTLENCILENGIVGNPMWQQSTQLGQSWYSYFQTLYIIIDRYLSLSSHSERLG